MTAQAGKHSAPRRRVNPALLVLLGFVLLVSPMTVQAGKHSAPQRKVNPALLVLLGVILLGALVYLVMTLGGGGSKQAAPVPAPAPAESPTAAPSGAPEASEASPSPSPTSSPTFELSESKDPFRPLVVPPTEGASGASSPAPTPVASAGPGAGGAPAPAGGQQVELLDVVDDQGTAKAQIRVGTTVSTVAPGQTFASTFKLLSIEGTCATMLNGDDKFTLCKGEQVLK